MDQAQLTPGTPLNTHHRLQQNTLLQMGEHIPVIAYEERIWHIGKLLAVLGGHTQWGCDAVSDEVVHEGSSTGAWVAQPHHLYTSM